MEQLDELIFNTIEALRNNKNQPSEDTTSEDATINKDSTSVTMEKFKERLIIVIDKGKLLN